MSPITVFCAFTRRWAVDKWINCFKNQDYDFSKIYLCAIIDIDEPIIRIKLEKMARELQIAKIWFKFNDDNNPNDVRIAVRRLRIAEIKNQSKELVRRCPAPFVIGLEDDTVFPPNTFKRLVKNFIKLDDVGFLEGVQCGRWGVKMIGGWRFKNIRSLDYVETIMPGEGIEWIDAGGFYGYITTKGHYLDHIYYWLPEQPWGPDVNFGIWLRLQGVRCRIDWGLKFGHNDHNVILKPDGNISKVVYNKKDNKWVRSDYETTS